MATILEYFGIPPSTAVETENRYRYLASLGQTTFSATYTVGYVDVFYNGASLDPALDFVATDGLHIILSVPCVGGEPIEIVSKRQVQNADIYSKEEVNSLLSNYYGIATGTGDTMSVNTSPTFNTFIDGLEIKVRTSASNTSNTPYIAINGLPSLAIIRPNETPLSGNDWDPNTDITLRYIQVLNKLMLMTGASSSATPAQFDSSSRNATTRWASSIGLKPAGILNYSSAVTLSASQAGSMVLLGGSSAYVVVLPSAASVPATNGFLISNISNQTLTLACSGADTTNSGSTFVFTPGTRYCIVSDGISTWRELYWANEVAPNFTAPTAVTPPITDNSTRLTTTAFSQSLGLHYGLQSTSTSASTVAMSLTNAGGRTVLTSASLQTVTLGDPSTLLTGFSYEFVKETTGATGAVINSFGGVSKIDSGNGLVSTLTLLPGEDVTLVWSGTQWLASGTNVFRRLAFPYPVGGAGAVTIPGGTSRQWGQFSLTVGSSAVAGKYEGSTSVSLPTAFPTSIVHVSPTVVDASGSGQQYNWWISAQSRTGFTLNVACLTASRVVSGTWEAVGY